MRFRFLAAGLILVLVPPAAPAEGVATGTPLFRITDPRLDELSGLAVGHRNPGVLYAQNDSGDSARFFALDAQTGGVRAVCAVPGAQNQDWEDLASAPSARGVASVWLADIGDNDAVRTSVQLYRVDEPELAGPSCRTSPPDVWRLRYPDGAHDAESLVVDPVRHRMYLITKELFGRSEVFQVPANPAAQVQTVSLVDAVQFRLTGTPGGPNPVGELTATGATMSADGSLLAIRTYTDAYLWSVRAGDVVTALKQPPTVLALPAQPQGEGIAITGTHLLIDSEQVGSGVFEVPIPARLLAPTRSAAPPVRSAASPGRSAVASPGPPSSAASARAQPPGRTRAAPAHDCRGGASALAIVLVLLGAGGLWRRRRTR